jgi:hypothetical protein
MLDMLVTITVCIQAPARYQLGVPAQVQILLTA